MIGGCERTVEASGVRILVDRVVGSPVTALYLWIEAGAGDEAEGEHGAAHFVEHMLFKGTLTRGVGEVAEQIEGLGGDINAWTTHDNTVLHATVRSRHWRGALEVLADMALDSAFDPEQIELERDVILEEIRAGEDDPSRVLSEAVAARAWKTHPYGRPVIGSVRSVADLDRESLVAWWRRWYAPSRMILVVSGDVEPAEVVREARRLLRGPAAPPPERPPRHETPQARLRTCALASAFDEPLVRLQFQGLPLAHPDGPVLDVLAEMLGGGSSSRLVGELKLRARLVTDVWAATGWDRDGITLSVGCVPVGDKVEPAIEGLVGQLAAVAEGRFGLQAVRRARTALVASRLFERETVDSRAHTLAWHEGHFSDPRTADRYEAQLGAVGLQDVRRVARRLLDARRCVAGVLTPEGTPGRVRLRSLLRGLPRPRGAAPCRPAPEIVRRVLPSGLTLVVDPAQDSPVVALRVVGLGGQLLERPSTGGRAAAWARCVMAGAADMDAVTLSAEIESRGGALGAYSGRNSQGLRAEFPVDRVEDGIDLLAQVLLHPRFEPRELERVIAELDEDERLLPDRPEDQGWRKVWRALHGPHPYGLLPDGTPGSRRRLRAGSLRRHHRTITASDNLVVAVSGGVDPEAVLARLAWRLAALPEPGFVLPSRPDSAWPSRARHLQLQTDRAQAHALWAWPGVRLLSPEAFALDLVSALLGGSGGRLFREVREVRGLAYYVDAGALEGWDAGSIWASVSTDPDRIAEAMEAVEEQIRLLAEQGPTPEELQRVKELALGGLAFDRQRMSGRAHELAFWERYGVPAQRVRPWLEEGVLGVDVAAIRRILSDHVLRRPGVRVNTVPMAPPTG